MSVAARSRQKQSPPGAIPAGRHNQVPPLGILARVGPPDALASSGLRPLLPAAAGPRAPGINPTPLLPRKRSAVLVACSACQKARTKCTGDRPACSRCQSRDLACVYNLQERADRRSANLEHAIRIADENTQLHELLSYLRTRTWTEAVEILRRIREAPNLGEAIQFIRDADLILQQR
ncbi:hypothetical protein NKR19_g9948 [Coniochaeta hoffmannii]|uniref:Zn(2)-C6 fungal-type domain-containing protein n=1 Tax=Coniochaeta hoffmannii TaxID=91930 RepID=A0AA38R824_9PEZI|nr:hypothetical protein NKR19_g9948 [Coniochaeta hoffmannii]